MSTKFLSPGWRMPRNANQSKQSNYSMDFDGSSQYIDLGTGLKSTFDGATAFTISAWFKYDTANPNYSTIIQQEYDVAGDNYLATVRLSNTSTPQISNRNVTLTDTTALNSGQWYHIVSIFDGSSQTLTMYIDGTQVAQNTSAGSSMLTSASGSKCIIGANANNDRFLDGQINGVAVFDYALPATGTNSVATIYGNGAPFNPMALPNPPIAYYPLGTSAWNGDYLAENNAIGDYVFDTNGNTSKYFNLPKTSVGSDDFTFSFWVKPEPYAAGGGDAGDTLLGNTNGTPGANQWNMWIYEPTGRLNLVWYNQTSSAGNFMTTNFSFGAGTVNQEWTHVVLTRVGTTVTFYFNGVADTATPGTLSSSSITLDDSSNATMRLPSPWGGTVYNQDGFYSNLLWHNVGLSSTEIETLYNYGSPIQTLANIPQSSNLKAWYKLDASEIYNSTSTKWQINEATSPWTSSLDFGTFTSNDRIIINNTFDTIIAGTNFTISSWINLDSLNSQNLKFIFTNETLQFTITNKIATYLRNTANQYFLSPFNSNTILTTGKWYNVVLVKSGNNYTYYLNGSADGTTSSSSSVKANSSETTSLIGDYYGTGTLGFDGRISNTQIFNSALPATGSNSIETLYNNGNPLADMSSFSSLVSWWKLNNTTTGIEDSKGTNNGTNNGATEAPGSVSTLNGESSGMNQSNLIQSDLQTVAPYSRYALSFDGTNDYIDASATVQQPTKNFSVSCWVNFDTVQSKSIGVVANFKTGVTPQVGWAIAHQNGTPLQFWADGTANSNGGMVQSTSSIPINKWIHVVGTYDGSNVKIYINGTLENTKSYTQTPATTDQPLVIGRWYGNYDDFYTNGSISNVSVWDTALTSAQVSEIYNQGLPGNLNSHSAYSNLVSWWQLGSNSSWNGNRWIVADEKGTNNGYSQNMSPYMPESGLTNGVGTTANGISTGMGVGALVGDAPYSTANAISSGMAVQAFDSSNPPNVISGRSEDVPS